jgi:hypothetical protein
MNISDRVGIFKVAKVFIDDCSSMDTLNLVFKDIIVTEASIDQAAGVYQYTAFSPLFDRLVAGDPIPTYKCTINLFEAKGYQVKWTKNEKST